MSGVKEPGSPPGGRRGLRSRFSCILGALLLLVVLVVPYAGSGLVAPRWGVVLLLFLWTLHAVLLVLVCRRHPSLAPLVPVSALAVWVLVVSLGGMLLGWTA